jgi:plasmid stability protein
MADLNIRNVDEGLIRELKKAAVEDGVSLREMCIAILGVGVKEPGMPHVRAEELERIREQVPLTKKDDSVVEGLLRKSAKAAPKVRKGKSSPKVQEPAVESPVVAEDGFEELDEADIPRKLSSERRPGYSLSEVECDRKGNHAGKSSCATCGWDR